MSYPALYSAIEDQSRQTQPNGRAATVKSAEETAAPACDRGHQDNPTISEDSAATAEMQAELSMELEAGPDTPRSRLEWALRYGKAGYRPIPLWWITQEGYCACKKGKDCSTPGKHPIEKDWRSASNDPQKIRKLFEKYSLCNIGLVMGEGDVAVDFENDYARDEADSRGASAETPTQRTGGGGTHRIYHYAESAKLKNAVRFMTGADLRTDGGLIVVEPSRTTKGSYSWDPDHLPNTQRAELPAWIAGLCMKGGNGNKPPLNIKDLWAGVPEGERNAKVFAYACKMRRACRPELEVLAVCQALGRRCKPPLSEEEVTAIVQSSARYVEESPETPVVCDEFVDFMQLEIEPRELLLEPIIRRKNLVMCYAWRGVGKTFFGLGLALALASGGSFLRWCADKAHGVLYVDGEMPAGATQERLRMLGQNAAPALIPKAPLRIISADRQEVGLPGLETPEGQAMVEAHLDGIEVLILDSLTTLVHSGVENEMESWRPLQSWFLKLRRRGITVIFFHHAGKGGAQRGTSSHEDVLDLVVQLKHPKDYEANEGCRFEVIFDKARGLVGEAVEPFEAKLDADQDGHTVWTVRGLDARELEQIVELTKAGLTARAIADEIGGISHQTVLRRQRKAREEGLL